MTHNHNSVTLENQFFLLAAKIFGDYDFIQECHGGGSGGTALLLKIMRTFADSVPFYRIDVRLDKLLTMHFLMEERGQIHPYQ